MNIILFYICFCSDYGLSLPFDRHASEVPTLQIAFQYTVVVPPEELSSPGPGVVSNSRYGKSSREHLFLMFTFPLTIVN